MSSHHSPQGLIDRKVLHAVAAAIRSLEAVSGSIVECDIGRDDAELLCSAMTDLWTILESNGYTIDLDTNLLRKVPP